jgi:hypothetical protein
MTMPARRDQTIFLAVISSFFDFLSIRTGHARGKEENRGKGDLPSQMNK